MRITRQVREQLGQGTRGTIDGKDWRDKGSIKGFEGRGVEMICFVFVVDITLVKWDAH